MRPVSEATAISIGLTIILLGGVFWLSSLYSLASNTEARTTKIEQKQDLYMQDMQGIKEDLAVIKQILKKDKN